MKTFWVLIFMVLLAACKQAKPPLQKVNGKTMFWYLLEKGDSIYSIRNSAENFRQALLYYDSAQIIADTTSDLLIKANMHAGLGRIYDAWKNNPEKTIYHYTEAANYYRQLKITESYIFFDYLTIYAYTRNADTAKALALIPPLMARLDSLWGHNKSSRNLRAGISRLAVEMNDFEKATNIINHINAPEKIRNANLNWRNDYIITNALLELHDKKTTAFIWLDSIKNIYPKAQNLSDSVMYCSILKSYFSAMNDWKTAYQYQQSFNILMHRFITEKQAHDLQTQLINSQLKEEQRTKQELLNKQKTRLSIILLLAVILGCLLLMIYFLVRDKKVITKSNLLLQEKINQNELLTKEIHHRVKNNLYMVYSLLKMQEKKLGDDETAIQHLAIARLRIESIALMHEQLMNHQNNLPIKAYINQLINTISENILHEKSLVSQLQIDEIDLDADTCFPIALIINEWITNTIKYAHTNATHLQLNLSLKKTDRELEIIYFDNGELEENKQIKIGLGTRIVQLLVQQLSGSLTNHNEKMFAYKLNLTLPETPANQ
jgi:two-component sensor histidine kinase